MIQLTNAVDRYNKLILSEFKEATINCWLAGGAIRDYFMGVPVHTDYDIFFPNETEYQKCYVYLKAKGCEVKWESDNGMKVMYNGKKYDLVKKFFPTPQETINAFDFTVSMFAVDSEHVYFGESSFIDLAKKQLMLNKIPFPASTMSRAFRYYKKGFTMCGGEMKKLVEAIQNMPKVEEAPQEETEEILSGDGMFGTFFLGFD